MATPEDRASNPARKLVMDKSKLMPALGSPEEETVRGFRQKQGKAKLESIRGMASAPKPSSVDFNDPSFDRAHKGKRQGERLPAAIPATTPQPEQTPSNDLSAPKIEKDKFGESARNKEAFKRAEVERINRMVAARNAKKGTK